MLLLWLMIFFLPTHLGGGWVGGWVGGKLFFFIVLGACFPLPSFSSSPPPSLSLSFFPNSALSSLLTVYYPISSSPRFLCGWRRRRRRRRKRV